MAYQSSEQGKRQYSNLKRSVQVNFFWNSNPDMSVIVIPSLKKSYSSTYKIETDSFQESGSQEQENVSNQRGE